MGCSSSVHPDPYGVINRLDIDIDFQTKYLHKDLDSDTEILKQESKALLCRLLEEFEAKRTNCVCACNQNHEFSILIYKQKEPRKTTFNADVYPVLKNHTCESYVSRACSAFETVVRAEGYTWVIESKWTYLEDTFSEEFIYYKIIKKPPKTEVWETM